MNSFMIAKVLMVGLWSDCGEADGICCKITIESVHVLYQKAAYTARTFSILGTILIPTQ